MIRLAAVAFVAVVTTACGGESSCESLDTFYADCCAECGEKDTYCDFEAGSDEEACDAAIALAEAFGGSLADAECLCDE